LIPENDTLEVLVIESGSRRKSALHYSSRTASSGSTLLKTSGSVVLISLPASIPAMAANTAIS